MYYKKFQFPFAKPGNRIQKIALNAGFNCPNRTGVKGYDGCIFCNNQAFIPFYSNTGSDITDQIEKGIDFFSAKYNTNEFVAYFQAYTNTDGTIEEIKRKYKPVVEDNRFKGIVIGTRPDCISDEVLEYIKSIEDKKYVKIEYGIETFNDKALKFCNRGHSAKTSLLALEKTNQAGIPLGVHFIIGLPFDEKEDIILNSRIISNYKVESIKLHQLQVLKDTNLENIYRENSGSVSLLSSEEYVELVVNFLEYLNPEIAVERFINEVPPEFLIAPKWGGLRVNDIVKMIEAEFEKRNSKQGKYFSA